MTAMIRNTQLQLHGEPAYNDQYLLHLFIHGNGAFTLPQNETETETDNKCTEANENLCSYLSL